MAMSSVGSQAFHVSESKGFLGSLFDFSFTSLVSSKLITLFYAILVIVESVVAIGAILKGFSTGALVGVGVLVVTAVVYLLAVIYSRVICEVLIVLFRIHENLVELVHQGQLGAAGR